jgi:hypothetical protein
MVAAEIELQYLGWISLGASNAEDSGGLLTWCKVARYGFSLNDRKAVSGLRLEGIERLRRELMVIPTTVRWASFSDCPFGAITSRRVATTLPTR